MEKDRAKLLNQPRRRKKTKITWVSTYDPRVPSKTAIIKTNFNLLHAHVVNKVIFTPRTIILVDRKRKNLAQTYKPTVPQRHVQHGPKNRPGFFPCKETCNTCHHSKETTVLVSLWDGRHWTIKQHITCSSPKTVYIVTCEAVHNEWYVGSTTNLKVHWRESYWTCDLGTIFKGMNTRKNLNTVFKDRSSRNLRGGGGD